MSKYRIKKEWSLINKCSVWYAYSIIDGKEAYVGVVSYESALDCETILRANIDKVNIQPRIVKEIEI